MREAISELELARQAFLLVMCERADGDVSRGYLAEKVNFIYRARHVWEITGALDASGQRRFARIFAGLTREPG